MPDITASRENAPPCEFWGLFHDGSIVDREGNVPGKLKATIKCRYLSNLFPSKGESFWVVLHDCGRFEYEPFEENPISNLSEIAHRKPEILYCRVDHGLIQLDCVTGTCRVTHGGFEISLDDGSPITVNELTVAAERYWENWQRKWDNGKNGNA